MNTLLKRYPLLPTPHDLHLFDGMLQLESDSLMVCLTDLLENRKSFVKRELQKMGFEKINFSNEIGGDLIFTSVDNINGDLKQCFKSLPIPEQSYILQINENGIEISANDVKGRINGISTLAQIVENNDCKQLPFLQIVDGPDVEKRIISPTLTWYAGFARVGFGTQLWGGDQWKEFIDWCFLHKINVLNVVMYGFWPFEFPEYSETVMRDIKMKTWSHELNDWIELSFTHPNLTENFLEEVIAYANEREIEIFAYVGMNSYNGGYAVKHPEKRMVLSEELKAKGHVNNYDSLCPSRDDVVEYLTSAVKRIEEIGFNGIVFEESEETQWFCQCDTCREKYGHLPPNDAKHQVTVDLLNRYAKYLKPDTVMGIRWLREPPIIKDEKYLMNWADKLPERVNLFWAPGLEDDDQEFIKWVNVFGKEKIWSRNCEGSGFGASVGRIPYLIPDTFPEEMKNFVFQHLRNDIAQFQGTANYGCTGINGYGFEWYGHENFFMATAQYGWNTWELSADEYLAYSSHHMFGMENGDRFERIIRNIPVIHETQISDTLPPFYFMPMKYVGSEGHRYLKDCVERGETVLAELKAILSTPNLKKIQLESAETLTLMTKRMIHVAKAGIYYNLFLEERDSNNSSEDRMRKFAKKALYHAEADYTLIKENYLDSKEHFWTGVPIGEYYIPMVINEYRKVFSESLGDDFSPRDDVPYIYGGESLPWVWLLEWAPKIAKAVPKAALYRNDRVVEKG